MNIHVETRLLPNYVQTLSTLIGQIISKLINDTESNIRMSICFVLTNSRSIVFKNCVRVWNKKKTFRK